MRGLEVFYSKALRYFEEAEGSEDEFKWFVGARLMWFGLYRNEVRLRLKMIEEISMRIRGRVLDVGSDAGFPALVMFLSGNTSEVIGIETTW